MRSVVQYLVRPDRRLTAAAAAVLAAACLWLVPAAIAKDRPAGRHWVATWAISPQRANLPLVIDGQTLRQVVHVSLGGETVRVRVSNAYGSTPLVIGAAHLALSAGSGSIAGGSDRVVTFGGSPTITIPAGALAVSDPIALVVADLDDVAVSLYFPDDVVATTQHETALHTTYLSLPGNFTAAATIAGSTTESYYFLTGIEVLAAKRARAIVALGDSFTDGYRSTVDTNQNYPSLLAARLQAGPSTSQIAVLNQGVGGNRLLHDFVGTSGAARFDRDVLAQSGAGYVIVLQGNVDLLIPGLIGNPAEVVTVAQLIQGHRQIIARAHAMGLKAFGGTLNPVEGYPFPGFWTPDLEAKRQAFNQWIRTSGAYDALIDFDQVLRDPAQPSRLLPAYDSGDHAHPNDDGYRAMADAIDLSLFRDSSGD
jgi:lysophospholipase L1-like esterase